MNEIPKIQPQPTTLDKSLEILGWTSIFAMWALIIINYTKMPDIIPIHYNGVARADGFGAKGNIFTLPLVATILFIGLTILNKFPHTFNYPTKITAENVLIQYANATRLIRYLKLIIVVIFGLIAFMAIQKTNELGIWFLPLTMAAIFLPLGYYVIKSIKTNK